MSSNPENQSRDSELGRILDESLNEIYIFDAETLKFIWVNQCARDNLGYSTQELQQLTPLDLKLELTPELFDGFLQPLKTGQQDRIQFEALHNRKDRSRYPVEVHLHQATYDSTPVYSAIILDITERKRAEAEREQLIGQLERKNTELERFTYTVAHDLKVPLVTLKGFLKQLQKNAALGNSTSLTADTVRILRQADGMARLLDDLLDLSRAGHVVSPHQNVSLGELAREAAGHYVNNSPHPPVCIEIDSGLPIVRGDRTRLLEVLQNLIENAIKFSSDQSETHLEIGVRQNSSGINCFVRDNGMGIEPADCERVFELFVQLDSTGKGTGIGLALCKRIVEAHGGRIWVESQGPGTGCTFHFTLSDSADVPE